MTTVAGADGCKAGWVCIATQRATRGTVALVFPNARALVCQQPSPAVLTVDIPIGLTEAGGRSCDHLARRILGRARGCSVFPAPVRAALAATSRGEASRVTQHRDGRRVSAQAWNIYAKVADMDRALRAEPGLRPRVREVHPEVCFWAWSGHRAMRFSKRTSAGRAERRSLVDGYFGVEAYDRVRGQFLARDVADDDILDAFAALWTAERIRDGRACTLPESPPTDTLGLRMEIVY